MYSNNPYMAVNSLINEIGKPVCPNDKAFKAIPYTKVFTANCAVLP